ncbi:hypothetical protein [Adlercreutzia sp. ZJ304]|uniref:ATP-grasp domain-containing protein n=1 Tax=Adlercreutzia sp. ZJ304 TaxID=2709791 RepID=UPI0013ED8511|nr:hypothetical protein [Adlercreutzia sp. ZJ304]
MNLNGKKLLILGGADQHCKLVEAAHHLGVVSYVVDYLDNSPAKELADCSAKIDIFNTEEMVRYCKLEGIDGAISAWLDPCQIPYRLLCSRMGFPCYGNDFAFATMTDKSLFKSYCSKYGVNTIPYECGFPDELMESGNELGFPLFVKPVDSRGSRGQGICHNKTELFRILTTASKESADGRVIVEQYMNDADDISVTYFFIDGHAYLERLSDRLLGSLKDDLGNVAIGTVSPSRHAEEYMAKVNRKVISMLKSLGCENGPAFMQGFVKDGEFYFYDPGLRFPGGDYERALKKAIGVDFAELLVEFALTGSMSSCDLEIDSKPYLLNDMFEVIHDVTVRSGKIVSIEGISAARKINGVVSVNCRKIPGDIVAPLADVGRRAVEVNFLSDTIDEAIRISKHINECIQIMDTSGDMKVSSMTDALVLWAEHASLEDR